MNHTLSNIHLDKSFVVSSAFLFYLYLCNLQDYDKYDYFTSKLLFIIAILIEYERVFIKIVTQLLLKVIEIMTLLKAGGRYDVID